MASKRMPLTNSLALSARGCLPIPHAPACTKCQTVCHWLHYRSHFGTSLCAFSCHSFPYERSKTLANSLPCTKPDAFGPSLLFGLLRFDICFFVLFFFLLFLICFILFFVFFCFLLFCFVVLGNGGLGAENCKLQKKQSPVFCSLRICGGKNRFHLRLQFFLPSVSCAAGKCATLWSRPRGARGKISNDPRQY